MDSSMEQEKKRKKYRLITKISSILLVILIFCVVGVSCLKIFASKNRFELLIESAFQYLESSLEKTSVGSVTGTFSFGMNLQSGDASDMAVLDIVNKLGLSGSYGIDYNKKLFYLDFDSNYDNK